jgi:hypothetical protein
MRTASEIELFPMAQDLISLVSLTKTLADEKGVTIGEACEIVLSAIEHGGEIVEIYRTDVPGIPVCIGELGSKYSGCHPSASLLTPFRFKWWDNPNGLVEIQPEWGGTLDSLAIQRDDAEKLLEVKLQIQVLQSDSPTSSPKPRKRKHYLDSVIKVAKNQCLDPEDVGLVWLALGEMVKEKSHGLLGITDKGIQYTDSEDRTKEFSKKQLTAYLKESNLKRKRPLKSA